MMPNVQEGRLGAWMERYSQLISDGKMRASFPFDFFAAGQWFMDELLERGVPEDRAASATFGLGQRQAVAREGWDPAVRMLARFDDDGHLDIGGLELADELIKARFGDPPDRMAMLRWFLEAIDDK